MAPLLAVAVGMGTNVMVSGNSTLEPDIRRTIWLVVGGICVLMVLAGLVCGVLALIGIRRHGRKGVLIPSIVGILLSSGYLYLLINAILLVRRLIEEGPPPVQ
jgi:hypothetical protein